MSSNFDDFNAWHPVPTSQADLVTVEKIRAATELVKTLVHLEGAGPQTSLLYQEAATFLLKQFQVPPMLVWNNEGGTTTFSQLPEATLEEAKKALQQDWNRPINYDVNAEEKPSDEMIRKAYGVPQPEIRDTQVSWVSREEIKQRLTNHTQETQYFVHDVLIGDVISHEQAICIEEDLTTRAAEKNL